MGAQLRQPAVGLVVVAAGDDAVAGGFRFELAGGVVTEIADQQLFGLTVAGEGQPGVFQLAIDCVGERLAVTQGVGLAPRLTVGGIGIQCRRTVARFEQCLSLGNLQRPVGRLGVA
ncbi:hypothetical protein FQZ97_1071870 [compost metagenome]